MSRRDCLLAALVAGLWGFNFVVIEWGMGDVPPLLFVAVRFVAVLVPAILLVPRPDAPWRTILTVGAFMSLGQFGLLYSAMAAGMPAGLAGLVLQAQVVLTILIAATVLRERPDPRPGHRRRARGRRVAGGRARPRWAGPAAGARRCACWRRSRWAVGNVVSRASGVPGGLPLTVWSALVVPVPLALLSLALEGPGTFAAAAGRSAGRRAGLDCLHGGARQPGRLRHLQRSAVAATPPRRWCRGSCWCRRSRSGRPGCCSASSRRWPSWPAGRCWFRGAGRPSPRVSGPTRCRPVRRRG